MSISVGDHNAGAVSFGGTQAAPANFDDDDTVQLTHAGWRRVTDGMATSIVRIQRELEEAQAQIAIYEAERSILMRERDSATKALRQIASMDTSQDASPQQCGAVLIAMNALEARQ